MAGGFAFLALVAANIIFVLCLSKEITHRGKALKHYRGDFKANSQLEEQDSVLLKKFVNTKRDQGFQTVSDVKLGEIESDIITLSKSRGTRETRRVKRVVYGPDTRYKVPPKFAEKCPFSAAVIISTGCSGVLVSPKHVLTSAHCLHNGSRYVDGYHQLRVGFHQKNGSTEWREISSTKMPEEWKNGSDVQATKFDYAIIKLSKRHSRCFLPLAPSKAFRYGDTCAHKAIHFTAFDEDREEGTMLYRSCRVETFTKEMLYHCCDAIAGSSGAGVYEINRNNATNEFDRKVIGVFSGNRDLYLRHPPFLCSNPGRLFHFPRSSYLANYNAVLRFNEEKVLQMCGWMKRLGGSSCKRVVRNQRRRRRGRREKHKRDMDGDGCQNML